MLQIAPYWHWTLLVGAGLALTFMPDRLMRGRCRTGIILSAVFGLFLILAIRLGDIWCSSYEVNGSIFANAARLINRFGWAATGGHIFFSGGSVFQATGPAYNHHPPGIVWLLTIIYRCGGAGEVWARLMPIGFTCAGFAILLWRLGSSRSKVFCGAFILTAAACPGLTYYGRMLNFEPACLALALITFTLADLRPRDHRLTVTLIVIQAILPWFGWFGLPLALAGMWLIARRFERPAARWLLIIPLLSVVVIAGHLASYGGGLREMFRASVGWTYLKSPGQAESISLWLLFIKYRLGRAIPLILLAFLPLLFARRLRARFATWELRIVILFLGMTMLGVITMPRAVMVHDYHWLWLWPVLALLAGVAADDTVHCARTRTLMIVFLLLSLCLGIRGAVQLHQPDQVYLVPEWKAARTVAKVTTPAEKVAVIGAYPGLPYNFIYYADRAAVRIDAIAQLRDRTDLRALVIFDLARDRQRDLAELRSMGFDPVTGRRGTPPVWLRKQ